MAGSDLTAALATLLSDSALRRRFAADPAAAAQALELSAPDRLALASIDPAGLERQAQTLLGKRRGAVARSIPLTWRRLGPAAAELFAQYADAFWPEGHQRHALDALAFLSWLRARRRPYCKLERLRLETRHGAPQRRRCCIVPSQGAWQLPALYIAWSSRDGWRERLVQLGAFQA